MFSDRTVDVTKTEQLRGSVGENGVLAPPSNFLWHRCPNRHSISRRIPMPSELKLVAFLLLLAAPHSCAFWPTKVR